MQRHYAWRPHLDQEPVFNPFVAAPNRAPLAENKHLELFEEQEAEAESAVVVNDETSTAVKGK